MTYQKKSSKQKKFEGHQPGFIHDEPVVKFNPPNCPKDLPTEAKRIWNRLAPDLIRARKLNQFNADNFKQHCIIILTLNRISKMIEETNVSLLQEDRLYDAATGKETLQYKESALAKMQYKWQRLLDASSKSFGFSAIQFEGHYRYEENEKESELI